MSVSTSIHTHTQYIFTFSHLSRRSYPEKLTVSKVKCLAQGHKVIWHGQESNWQPSDY